MKSERHPIAKPEKRLQVLAREFRGTKDENKRSSIAESYAEAVEQLIKSKKWKKIPTLEDQLPDEWMPEQFFTFWSLRPPARQNRRTG